MTKKFALNINSEALNTLSRDRFIKSSNNIFEIPSKDVISIESEGDIFPLNNEWYRANVIYLVYYKGKLLSTLNDNKISFFHDEVAPLYENLKIVLKNNSPKFTSFTNTHEGVVIDSMLKQVCIVQSVDLCKIHKNIYANLEGGYKVRNLSYYRANYDKLSNHAKFIIDKIIPNL